MDENNKQEMSVELLKLLPFRVSIEILRSVKPFSKLLRLNIDKDGKVFEYKEGTTKDTYGDLNNRNYYTISHFIRMLFGYFKIDRFRKPFLLYRFVTFNGERFINNCTYSDHPMTHLHENVVIPIPRKVVTMEITNLGFSDKNLPNFEKLEFLESFCSYSCRIKGFSKSLKKFTSERLEDMSFRQITGDEYEVDESFLPILVTLEKLSFLDCESIQGELIKKIISYKGETKLRSISLLFKKSIIDPLFENYHLRAKNLDLTDCRTSDRICRYLSLNKSLKELSLYGCTITFNGLIDLFESPSITSLTVGSNKVNFGINYTDISDLKQVKNRTLKELCIIRNWQSPPQGDFFLYLSENVLALETLNLYENDIGDQQVPSICLIRSLKTLILDYNSVTKASVPHFTKLKNLEYLDLNGSGDIHDEEVLVFIGMKSLQTLDIGLTKVTDQCVEYFSRPNHKISNLNVHYTKMTQEGIDGLKKIVQLEVITYGFETGYGSQQVFTRTENVE